MRFEKVSYNLKKDDFKILLDKIIQLLYCWLIFDF